MANDNTTGKTKYNNQSSNADGPSSSGSTTGRIIWWVAISIIAASLFFIFRALPFDQLMSALKDWIAGLGYWGPLAFGVVYVVATICFIPGTILTLAAGALFGLWIGLAVVSVSSTINKHHMEVQSCIVMFDCFLCFWHCMFVVIRSHVLSCAIRLLASGIVCSHPSVDKCKPPISYRICRVA